MIQGNISGIRQSVLTQMETMLKIECGRDEFLPPALIEAMAAFTGYLGREISVYITRAGSILDITVGDSSTVSLPGIHSRRSLTRLCGVRCIHTHPGGDSTLSSVDLQSLRTLRLDSMCAIGVTAEGHATTVSAAFLDEPGQSGEYGLLLTKPYPVTQIPQENLILTISEADRRIAGALPPEQHEKERAFLIGVAEHENTPSLLELQRLAETAGAQVVARFSQNRPKIDPGTYIGTGKAREIALLAQSADIDIIIMDDELTGAQVRNLEEIFGCRVVDRTALILDIFAQRASTREGKLQVELAQMQYQLPRLTGLGAVLSRLGGGIGTRGPGETKLEVDRRRIRRRIVDIGRELEEVRRQRLLHREQRERKAVPVVALVGYTNAGKSTILNLLTDAGVLSEDKLFATLDPVTRRITLPGGMDCLLVDTVGFISKLPHELVTAFRATLEEVLHADLLCVVQDVADENFAEQQEVVLSVLSDLGAGDKPLLHVYNKCDLVPELTVDKDNTILISAKTGQGVDEMLAAIRDRLRTGFEIVEFTVPYTRGDVVSFLHKYGTVQSETYTDEGTVLSVLMDAPSADRAAKMLNP